MHFLGGLRLWALHIFLGHCIASVLKYVKSLLGFYHLIGFLQSLGGFDCSQYITLVTVPFGW